MTKKNITGDFSTDHILNKIENGKPVSPDERTYLAERKAWLESRPTFGSDPKVKAITDALEKLSPTEPVDEIEAFYQMSAEERALAILTAREIRVKRGQG